jgi:uncharacterized OsmC-like protein
MTTTTETSSTRNGVDTATLFATIDLVRSQPELAQFRFVARNTWIDGTHSRGVVSGFHGAGQDLTHVTEHAADTDHPVVLCGSDQGATPVEMLLLGLAGCLTAGLANIAAARGVTLRSVESTVEGDIDLQGILGLSKDVRNGFEGVRVSFHVDADCSPEQVEQLVAQSRARSAVFDVLTNGCPVTVSVA